MPLPQINITFQMAANTAVARSQKGVVAVIVKNAAVTGAFTLTTAADMPEKLTDENRAYVARAFLGYVSAPRSVLLYVLPADAKDLTAALTWLATQDFDYLAAPPDTDAVAAGAVKAWITAQREQHRSYKAVLPNLAADSDAIVNVTATDVRLSATQTLTTAQLCSRIAGLIAGTPMAMSCTYAPLPEVQDMHRLSTQEANAAIDRGEFILVHDGAKAKAGRGVNSMTTLPLGKSAIYKKIKLRELLDMVDGDLRRAMQDAYIGKFANSYQNKLVLMTAVSQYFRTLEDAGLLRADSSGVSIDLDAQRAYLIAQHIDVSAMTDAQLREANTGSEVFLIATISPLDAIEDITLRIGL